MGGREIGVGSVRIRRGIEAGVLQGLGKTPRAKIFSRDVTQENVIVEMKKTLKPLPALASTSFLILGSATCYPGGLDEKGRTYLLPGFPKPAPPAS
jgi:hypothetical protein